MGILSTYWIHIIRPLILNISGILEGIKIPNFPLELLKNAFSCKKKYRPLSVKDDKFEQITGAYFTYYTLNYL